jgi:hypothetical protein
LRVAGFAMGILEGMDGGVAHGRSDEAFAGIAAERGRKILI